VQVEEQSDTGDQSPTMYQFSHHNSGIKLPQPIIKKPKVTDENRNVSRFVAQAPKPFKMNIDSSSKYLINNLSKDDIYIPADDDTSEDDDLAQLNGIKHLN
jgi:hypothetical protein